MWNITCQHYPRSKVHHNNQLYQIDEYQTGRKEYSHPYLSLVIYQCQYVFSNFKVTILTGFKVKRKNMYIYNVIVKEIQIDRCACDSLCAV